MSQKEKHNISKYIIKYTFSWGYNNNKDKGKIFNLHIEFKKRNVQKKF